MTKRRAKKSSKKKPRMDDLDKLIAAQTAKSPDFPAHMAAAEKRLKETARVSYAAWIGKLRLHTKAGRLRTSIPEIPSDLSVLATEELLVAVEAPNRSDLFVAGYADQKAEEDHPMARRPYRRGTRRPIR